MKLFSSYTKQLGKHPVLLMYLLCILLLLTNLAIVHHGRPYNSDDVSWQNILLTWSPFKTHLIYLGGVDSFIAKLPFLMFFDHFFETSRKLLFLESAFFATASFSFLYISGLYFLKKLGLKLSYVNLLPFLWLSSFGPFVGQLYLNPILRNFEVGLSFLFFVLAAKIFYKEDNTLPSLLKVLVGAFAIIVGGILAYSDPYFAYFTLVPIMVLFAYLRVRKKVSRQQLALITAGLLCSLGVAWLTSIAVNKLNLHLAFTQPAQFVSFDHFFSNIGLALHSMLTIFGADFFGQKVFSFRAVSSLLNMAILSFILYRLSLLLAERLRKQVGLRVFKFADLWEVFLACLAIFVLAVFTFSNVAVNLDSYRYLIIMLFALILYLALSAGRDKPSRAVYTLLMAATACNIGMYYINYQDIQKSTFQNKANSENFLLINALKKSGVTKGYTTYWDGNINTYLSKGSLLFLPTICSQKTTKPYNFLVDTTLFSQPAKKSFYIIDPSLNFPPVCSEASIMSQFGQPKKTLYIGDKKVLLYPYDIYTKM